MAHSSRRRAGWLLGGLLALAALGYLGVWAAAVLFGAMVVPAAWLPTSHRVEFASHEVTVAQGWQAGHSWTLTAQDGVDGHRCVQAHLNGLEGTRHCGRGPTGPNEPLVARQVRPTPPQPYEPAVTEFPGTGQYLTFGRVPASAMAVIIRYPNGSSWRVRALEHPEVALKFFYVVAAQPTAPRHVDVRFLDSAGKEVPT